MGSVYACQLYVTAAVFLALHIKEESLGKQTQQNIEPHRYEILTAC